MRFKLMLIVCFVLSVLMAPAAWSQDMIVYPAKGQSQDQMERDKYECYSWAKRETGFDPMEVPTATAPPPQSQETGAGVLRGAAGGALLGLGIGAIAGDSGKGAAIGALSGGVIGGVRRNEQQNRTRQQRQQWEREQNQIYMQKRNTYNRAYSACLEGRGYTVK